MSMSTHHHDRRSNDDKNLKHNERLWSVIFAIGFVLLYCSRNEILGLFE